MSASTAHSGPTGLPVAIQRYFEVALYLLVLTGFGTLASTGGLGVGTVLLVGAALVLRGYLLAARRSLVMSERWTSALTVGYVAFSFADYWLLSSGFLNTSVHLVLFVMVVRMFSAQHDRDYYFLAVISFLMVLSAAVLTVDSTFLFAFAAFMLTAVVTFILMEMRHVSARATVHSKESNDLEAYRHMAFSLAGASPALVLCILLGAGAIFFVMPRVSAGYLGAYAPGNELSTGFSEHVDLGRIGQIQQSSAVVMHIQIGGDQLGSFDLKWRGTALSDFDGKTWSGPGEQRIIRPSTDGTFALWHPEADGTSLSHRFIHYRILMEPVGSNVFFLAAKPQSLRGDYRLLGRDGGEAVFDLDAEHPVNAYEASSDIAQPEAAELRAAGESYPIQVLLNYTKLPPLDGRIAPLAAQITASADNSYDKAAALENYLRTHFTYSLQLPRTLPRDPLANFLFERRQGHCEYFASSMAVMLRTLRIPSRVVNGFRTGEFNDLTSQYVVRASNAHSWVEAYFPGYGWVSFDPTPAAPVPMRTGWNRAMLYLDAMASFWREWVVNYDLNRQQALGATAASRSQQLVRDVRHWWMKHYQQLLAKVRHARDVVATSPRRWSLLLALLAMSVLFAVNASWLLRSLARRRLAANPGRSPGLAASIWYERMTRMLARRGWPKSAAQTAGEFVIRIEDGEMRARVARFTRHYENARFGESAEAAERLPELYEEISSVGRR